MSSDIWGAPGQVSGNPHASNSQDEDEEQHNVHIVWGGIESSETNSASHEPSSESTAGAKTSEKPENVSFLEWSSSHPSIQEEDVKVKDAPKKEVAACDLSSSLPSVGSAFHVTNDCKPCLFTRAGIQGCTSGYECRWCHYPHEELRKARPCKSKRDRYKKHLQLHSASVSANKEGPSRPKQLVNL